MSGTLSDQSFLLKDLEVLFFRLFCFCILKFYCGFFDFPQCYSLVLYGFFLYIVSSH